MPPETLIALLGIAFAAAWTPGPNNAMLASSGATFGLRRTLPHSMGVAFGFPVMMFAVAIGLGAVFRQSELLRDGLRLAGAGLLIWIAWRIAHTARPGSGGGRATPFSFLQAAAFQWVNPKGWAMCIAIVAQFVTGDNPVREALICSAAFLAAGLTSSISWAGLGSAIGRLLSTDRRLQAFNWCMAALVAASVALVFL
jgi:threonine/homoserine/homoserine lactone efflux protein